MSSFKITFTDVRVGISIQEFVESIKKIIGFESNFYFNAFNPEETMIKLSDPYKFHTLGWKHLVEFMHGV